MHTSARFSTLCWLGALVLGLAMTGDALPQDDAQAKQVLDAAGVKSGLCIHQNGRWTKLAKARSQEMDEWTHPQHGPDGNMVSADSVVQFPVGLRWLDGVPMNFVAWAACRCGKSTARPSTTATT